MSLGKSPSSLPPYPAAKNDLVPWFTCRNALLNLTYSIQVFVALTAARATYSFFAGYPVVADFYRCTSQADVAMVRNTVGNISRRTLAARAQCFNNRVSNVVKNDSISIVARGW